MINVMYLRQLYKRREIAKVKQINRDSNFINAIIKSKLLLTFKRLIDTNRIELKIVEQVECTTDNSTDLKAQDRAKKEGRKKGKRSIQMDF